MNEVLGIFYWIIAQTANWFSSVMVEENISLGSIMIAVILSGLAATYIVMSAKITNPGVEQKRKYEKNKKK